MRVCEKQRRAQRLYQFQLAFQSAVIEITGRHRVRCDNRAAKGKGGSRSVVSQNQFCDAR